MKKIVCLSAFVMIFACSAFGDIRLPNTPTPKPTPKIKSVDANLEIKLDNNATDATLIIPKSQIKQLRAQLDDLDGGAADSNPTNAGIFTRTQTIASGMFLSLAMIFGGVWMARGRKNGGKINKTIAAAAAILFCVGSAATIAFANAGPPAVLRNISGQLFNQDAFRYWSRARGNIKLQISKDDDDTIVLVVPNPKDEAKPKSEE